MSKGWNTDAQGVPGNPRGESSGCLLGIRGLLGALGTPGEGGGKEFQDTGPDFGSVGTATTEKVGR